MSKTNKADDAQADQVIATEDLSDAIEESIGKEPGEEVRSVRLYDDYYRCNWWVRDLTPGLACLNLGKIGRSKFLKATRSGEKLVIEDLSRRA